MEGGREDEIVHGRIPLTPAGDGNGARGLGTGGKEVRGLFHVAGAEKLSRWQIGQLLARRCPELKASIEPASAKDFPGPPRALDTSLNIAKVQSVLSVPLPGLGEWLAANPDEKF